MLRKGDSVVTTQLVDTLFKKGMQQQIPFAKKGDQIKTYIKILEVFQVDSIARRTTRRKWKKTNLAWKKKLKKQKPSKKKKKKRKCRLIFLQIK
jgi:hypothetical protein